MTQADNTADSAGNAAELERAIAVTLADLLAAAAEPEATAATWSRARDAAQMLSLEGLDHALAACSAHAGGALPADIVALADRLSRMAAVLRESGDLGPLREADAELNVLADELNSYEWTARSEDGAAERRAAIATLEVTDVLEDVVLANDESRAVARRSRLPVQVAAAVRAAIDWLSATPGGMSVRLHGEPSLLELRMAKIRTDRLYAAHRVIAAAGGNLGPASDGDGWSLRVASFAERPMYLLLVQGGLRVAVPWHAVLKLRIVAAKPAAGGMGTVDHPVLGLLAPSTLETQEHPVVLIGHGLKRAYLTADRLIWRMTAEPCENEWGSPAVGLSETVRTEDGEVFWVADPARLLADIELPDIALEPEPVVLGEANVEPLGVMPEAVGTPVTPVASATPVTPVVPVTSVTPATPAAPAAPATAGAVAEPKVNHSEAAPAPEWVPIARALVADDSLTTRLLLSRMLEQNGFTVETVASSQQLMERLHDSSWTVLFTDLEMPDGAGPEWLRIVSRTAASRPHPVRVVALVRDGGDLDVARSAGVEETLLKPFVRDSLGALLARHGWGNS